MSKPSHKWERIDDVLTPQGFEAVKAGTVLKFSFEGSPINLKVMRKSNGKVWAKRIELYKPDEVEIVDN